MAASHLAEPLAVPAGRTSMSTGNVFHALFKAAMAATQNAQPIWPCASCLKGSVFRTADRM